MYAKLKVLFVSVRFIKKAQNVSCCAILAVCEYNLCVFHSPAPSLTLSLPRWLTVSLSRCLAVSLSVRLMYSYAYKQI